METVVFTSWLLFLMFSPVVPLCLPTDFTLHVEKPECDFCVAINTTICMGYCTSWDRIRLDKSRPPYIRQIGCTYDKVEHRTAILPGCPIEADPVFTYPVALSCRCDFCKTETNECVQRASPLGSSCTKPVRRLYPYPDQSDYMTSY